MCKRKPAARRLREKALYCPFLKEGVRNVARSTVGLPTFTFVRARAHSFPLSKRARLFPSAAYRRSASPQLAVGIRTPCGLESSNVVGCFCGVDERTDFLCPVGGGQAYPLRGEMLQCSSYFFATQKASGISNPRWPFEASHEACRRMAVFTVQAAGTRTRPASRGTCRATAVKPRPSCKFLYAPARPRRAVRGAGVLPLLSFCQRLRRFSRMARRSPKSRAPTPYTR